MKNITLKLLEDIFIETEEILEKGSMSRNRHINAALRFYNSYKKGKKLKEKLSYESQLVGQQSMSVLEDFDALYEID